MTPAIKISRSTTRFLLAGVAVLVIVLAVVMWPHTKPAAEAPSAAGLVVPISPVPSLPRGADACPVLYRDVTVPFDAGARGTPMTSCGFVEEVRRAYATTPPPTSPMASQIAVASPSTHKVYKLVCFETGGYATCTGGQGAVIYLYNKT
jgi:hypothetical protein